VSRDFFSRWSRRKRAAVAPPEPKPAATGEGAPAEEAAVKEVTAETPPLELPSVETLTAGSDLTAFMQAGVPARLRNAALRRMWSLDPEIRDFVGDARDYAWDWNLPGGVPGTGPLSLEEVSHALDEVQRSLGGDPSAAEPVTAEAPPPEPSVVEPAPGVGSDEPRPDGDPPSLVQPRESLRVEARDGEPPSPPNSAGAPLRRHGGARPV